MSAVISVSVNGSWTWDCPECGCASSLKSTFTDASFGFVSHYARIHEQPA